MPLTLAPSIWTGGDGSLRYELPTTANTIQYLVQGLPDSHFALIGHNPDAHPIRWQFVYDTPTKPSGDWQGDYATPEEALAALSDIASKSTS